MAIELILTLDIRKKKKCKYFPSRIRVTYYKEAIYFLHLKYINYIDNLFKIFFLTKRFHFQ